MLGRLKDALGGHSAPPSAPAADAVPASRFAARRSDELADAELAESQPAGELQLLLSHQQADGSFRWTDDLRHLVEQGLGSDPLRPIERALASFGGAAKPEVAHTIAVLLLLENRFGSQKPLWQRAARKAVRDFLSQALGRSPAEVDRWLENMISSAVPNA
jgi:hypothetical protein